MTKQDIFLICPLGFEELAEKELYLKLIALSWTEDFSQITKIDGGVQLSGDLNKALALNDILKIPSRILLRLKQQKCRDLPKLYNILKKYPWKDFLKQENVKFVISARKSRLIHTKKIENTAIEALSDYFMANKIKKSQLNTSAPDQAIYLRFDEDLLTISLDTSGEHLHKRSKSFRGLASIRENYAAALLLKLIGEKPDTRAKFISPMCGSGTFIEEAGSFFKKSKHSFAYQNWNLDGVEKIGHLKNNWDFSSLSGHDIDQDIIQKLSHLDVEQKDIFQTAENDQCFVILNPPYGKRIKLPMKKKAYFEKIINHIKDNYQFLRFGIIIPADVSKEFPCQSRLRFNQNGILVEFLIFESPLMSK